MNAVLQSLVGMETFANDVLNQKLVQTAQKQSLTLYVGCLFVSVCVFTWLKIHVA